MAGRLLRENVSMTDILPTNAGNVTHGLIFNYFFGYLRHILPVFRTTVMDSDVYRLHPTTTYPRFIILLPDSCAVPKIESHGALHVQQEGYLSFEKGSGDKKRVFEPTIYSIAQNGEEYHFLGEFPTILSAIAKLRRHGILGAGVDLSMQAMKFEIPLKEYRENGFCYDSVTLIPYNDKEKTAAEVIWDELRKPFTPLPQSLDQMNIDEESPKIMRQVGTTDMPAIKTTITIYDLPKDKAVAEEIMKFLKGKKVNFSDGDGQMELSMLQEARWNIFVLSRDSLHDQKMTRKYQSAIDECLKNNRVQVIPILVEGTDVTDLPSRIKWITELIILQSSRYYLEKLWYIMQGDPPPDNWTIMKQEHLQVDDVSTALTWTYLLNYLPIALLGKTQSGRGLRERFEDAIKLLEHNDDNPRCRCVPRLFIIIPKSCASTAPRAFPAPRQEVRGEEELDPMNPIMEGTRTYGMNFYRLTLQNGDQYCYAREYATPILAMSDMCHSHSFAALHTEDLPALSVEFATRLRKLVGNQDFKEKVGDLQDSLCCVWFDDALKTMPDALCQEFARYQEGDLIN